MALSRIVTPVSRRIVQHLQEAFNTHAKQSVLICNLHHSMLPWKQMKTCSCLRMFYHSSPTPMMLKKTVFNNEWKEAGKFVYQMLQKIKHPDYKKLTTSLPEAAIYEQVKSVVEKIGCCEAEILEWPEVLLLENKDIELRVISLHAAGQEAISIPLLQFDVFGYKSKKKYAADVRLYVQHMEGFVSLCRYLKSKELSDDDIVQMFSKFRFKITRRNTRKIPTIMKMLTDHGVSVEEIVPLPNVFDSSIKVIQNRLSKFKELGLDGPVQPYLMGVSTNDFEKAISAKQAEKDGKEKRKKYVVDTVKKLSLSKQIEEKLLEMLMTLKGRPSTNLPKVELLLANGMGIQSILGSPYTLNKRISKLRDAIFELNRVGLVEKLSLQQLNRYLSSKTISRTTVSKAFLVDLLECKPKVITKDIQAALNETNQSEHVIDNLNFLLHQGFTKRVIQQLPIILFHDSGILSQYWHRLPSILNVYSEVKDNKVQLLNGLQYCIERDLNFKTMVAIKI